MPDPIKWTMGWPEWSMLIVLSVVWGATFFFFAIAITGLPTFTIVFLRVAIAAATLWAVIFATGLALPGSRPRWRDLFLMGFLNNAVPFSLIVWAQHEIAASLASILNAATPFFTLLVAHALTRDEKLTTNRLAGVAVGFVGVAVMVGPDLLQDHGGTLAAQFAVLAASLIYAFAAVFGRRFRDQPPLISAAGQTSASAVLLLPVVLVIDRPWTLPMPGPDVWAAIAGLALLSTALAYVLYFAILKRAGAGNLLLVTLLVPVSAVALGTTFLDEKLLPQHLVGAAAIALGLALVDGRILNQLRARAA